MLDVKSLPKKTYDIDKLKADTRKKIDELTSTANILKDIEDKLSNVWFQKGDIVLDRGGEKAIVCGITVGSDDMATRIDATLIDKLYVTIATQDGYKRVSFDDIVPYNEAAKVLYGK